MIDGGVLQNDITPVLDAYTHALLATHPRARYVVGKDTTIILLIQALPEWLGDRVLRFLAFKNKKRPIPAACL